MNKDTKHFTYYIPVTGEIVANVIGTLQPSLAAFNYIEGIYPAASFYISDGVAKERREMLTKVNGLTITGIPVNSTVTINGEPFVVTDGSVDIIRPGSLQLLISIEHINYIKKEYVL